MLNDQFGIAGLLAFIRAIDINQSLLKLALGQDLTDLNLDLSLSPSTQNRSLHKTFNGPYSELLSLPHDTYVNVPEEYRVNLFLRERLPPVKYNGLKEDLLFYLFYNCPAEIYQIAVADELFARGWRYHKTENVWLIRSSNVEVPISNTGSCERSFYDIFDTFHWCRVTKEMLIEYKDIEHRMTSQNTAIISK